MTMKQIHKETIRVLSSAELMADEVADASPADLVLIGVNIKRCIDALQVADKAAKERIKVEAVDGVLMGDAVKATVVEAVRWTLNKPAIVADMGEDWVTAHSKQSVSVSVRYGV